MAAAATVPNERQQLFGAVGGAVSAADVIQLCTSQVQAGGGGKARAYFADDEMFLAAAEATAEADQLFVVKFGADWCGPCRQIAPVFRQMAMTISPVALFGHVDVDENEATAARFGIKSLPTILFLRAGGSSSSSSSSSISKNNSPGDVVAKIEGGGGAGPKHSTTRSWSSRQGRTRSEWLPTRAPTVPPWRGRKASK